jgi:hypothetical protein
MEKKARKMVHRTINGMGLKNPHTNEDTVDILKRHRGPAHSQGHLTPTH